MTTLLLLLVLHGLFLAVMLAAIGRRHDPANATLAALVFAASLLLLDQYLWASGVVSRWPHAARVLTPVWFLIGPLAYRYVQRFLQAGKPLQLGWVAAPPLAATLWLMPFYLQPAAAKLAMGDGDWLASTIALYSGFWLLTGWCAHRAWLTLREAQARDPDRFAQAPWHAAWLRSLMGGLAIYAVMDFALTLSLVALDTYPAIAGVISVLLVTSLIYGVGLLVVMPEGLLARAPWPGKRYQRAEIPESVAQAQVATLEQIMLTRRPWLDDHLDLQRLAELLDVTPHQLSQLLSQHLDTSFADYVNRHRVEEARRLLREVGGAKSILDIGMESGFGSSATFYRAFKKHAGTTPREFLAAAATDNVEPIPRKEQG